jgi:hypothetical protein
MYKLRDVLLAPLVVLFALVVLLVVAPLAVLAFLVKGVLPRAWFSWAHQRHGRFVLLVYSESPNWQPYIEEHILPRLWGRVVVLNWSQRLQWPLPCPWEARVFHHFTGRREFNPIVLVFAGRWRVVRIHFYRAFLELKHGREAALRGAEAELFAYLPPLGAAAA